MAAEKPTLPVGTTDSFRNPSNKRNPFLPGNRPSDKKTAQLPNSLADQLLKPVSRYDEIAPILEEHGYDQTKYKKDREYFDEVYNQWKDLLKLIPGLSRGTLESQMIAQARDPSIPKDWPKGSATRPPVTWKVPPDSKDGKHFPYRQP